MKRSRRLGVHTSIAGGVHLSLERAHDLGCTTEQIFSHNPRTWKVAAIPAEALHEFKRLRKAYDITPVFVHTSYLINLAAAPGIVRDRSIRLLSQEMALADSLGADYVVLHTGSASGDGERAGRKRAIDALREVSEKAEWNARILLENTAGERGDITSRMSDLAEVMEKVGGDVIDGICIDTCHAFQAGYDLAGEEGLDRLVSEIRAEIGIEKVKLIHLNDSKRSFNARVDRHEHIGEGTIGVEGFKRLLSHPALAAVPIILETPKKSENDDTRNLEAVRRLLSDRSAS